MTTVSPGGFRLTLARAGGGLIGLAATLAMVEAILPLAAFSARVLNRPLRARSQRQ